LEILFVIKYQKKLEIDDEKVEKEYNSKFGVGIKI
jgi:hypothetical protein